MRPPGGPVESAALCGGGRLQCRGAGGGGHRRERAGGYRDGRQRRTRLCLFTWRRPAMEFPDPVTHAYRCFLGDVTGDGYVDILAASGDHFLYCLDARGRLQWRYGTGLRLIAPPTLDDVDLDGRPTCFFAAATGNCDALRRAPAITCRPCPGRPADMIRPRPGPFSETARSGNGMCSSKSICAER